MIKKGVFWKTDPGKSLNGVVLAGKIKSVFRSFHVKLEAQGTSSTQVSSSEVIAGKKPPHPRNLQSLSSDLLCAGY